MTPSFKVGDRVIVAQHWFEDHLVNNVRPGTEYDVVSVDRYIGGNADKPDHMVVRVQDGSQYWVQYAGKGAGSVLLVNNVTDAEVEEAIASIRRAIS